MEEATVNDVRDRILEERMVAYITIRTVMKNLADKGYLTNGKEGGIYVYSPARPADEVRSNLLEQLTQKVFEGLPDGGGADAHPAPGAHQRSPAALR